MITLLYCTWEKASSGLILFVLLKHLLTLWISLSDLASVARRRSFVFGVNELSMRLVCNVVIERLLLSFVSLSFMRVCDVMSLRSLLILLTLQLVCCQRFRR